MRRQLDLIRSQAAVLEREIRRQGGNPEEPI